jgi:hypothetical protein
MHSKVTRRECASGKAIKLHFSLRIQSPSTDEEPPTDVDFKGDVSSSSRGVRHLEEEHDGCQICPAISG